MSMDLCVALSQKDRAKRYRAKRKAQGLPNNSGKSGASDDCKFRKGMFIALDGEGESVGEKEKFEVGSDGKTYYAAEHHYTLLAASTGESLFNGGKRLETQACIDFLLNLGSEYKKGIFVIFAGGYDINHILMFGFDKKRLKQLSSGETIEYTHNDVWYQVEYRARKSLTLRRGRSYVADSKGQYHQKWDDKITVWDSFGFFQESFIGVMGKWLGRDHKHYELIKKMKAMRGDFASVAQKEINDYNAAELECLVELMDKVRDAMVGLDLTCKRWDGAGAVAAALFQKHGVKQYKARTPDNIDEAVRTAYAGGRIELCKIGFHDGAVYDYDVNSAYPSVMYELPSLADGVWQHGTGEPPKGFTLCRVKYDFAKDLPFYPFFFRTAKMQISFPAQGEGWYWYPEYEAAQLCTGYMECLEYWHFKPSADIKPFAWIKDYYETRQQWVKKPTEAWQAGGEKIIKLGLNSLYGKTAQQLGGSNDRPPPYHQMEWAGYITSKTRARLFEAAMTSPASIIGFATDGIFSTKPLPLKTSDKKDFGFWELKQPVPKGMTVAMAGVYWWHDGENTYTHFSRGFDKDSMKTPHLILSAWAGGKDEIDIPMHRLIGIGSACTSDDLWKMRGRFTEGFRTLRLDGKSHKRNGCDVKKQKPHRGLVDLIPSLNIEYGYDLQKISHPYPVKWAVDDDFANDLEIGRETEDTYSI